MIQITQYFLRVIKPMWFAIFTRIFYFSSKIKIGRDFRTDSIPRILIDKNCKLLIGDNVEFRRNIEIRIHNSSQIKIGNNVRIDRGARFLATNKSKIEICDGCRIGLYSILNGGDNIFVGKKTLISGFVYLQTSMHQYKNLDKPVQDQGFTHAPVILEEDTWLGTHVVVLPGVTIGSGSVVGSNAVVTKSVLPNKIVGGIPAKTIKER